MKRILVISAFIFTISGHAMAQEASSMAMPFLSIDRNAATAALGGARVTSALYNPAAIPFSGSDTQLSYQLWAPQSAKANHINLLSAFRTGEKFGFSVKLAYQMATPYNIIDKNGKSGAAFTPADLIIGAGVGFAFNRFLSLGLQVCYTDQKLGENINASAIAADLFLLYKTGGLKASAGVSRLGTPVKSGNYSYSLPASAKAGASYGFPFGLSLSADFDYYFTGGMGLSGGVQYAFKDMVFVRGGYHFESGNSPLPSYASVGLGIKISGIHLDVAYLTASQTLGNTLTVGLGYAF